MNFQARLPEPQFNYEDVYLIIKEIIEDYKNNYLNIKFSKFFRLKIIISK